MSVFRCINAQFDLGPWWAKILLAVFYAVGFTAIWFGAHALGDSLNPANRSITRWIEASFGEPGLEVAVAALFAGIAGVIFWSKRHWG